MINIAPTTEWMEQEKQRNDHEAAKQRLKEKQEANALAQLHMQQQAQPFVPKNQEIMRKQNDAKVVGRYKIIKKDNSDK
jgi:hypothetical protein